MIKFTLISLCIGLLCFNHCLSQSVDNSKSITNDIRLSITVQTNVFQTGSSSVCITTLTNSSTNSIEIDPSSPNTQASQLEIFLTDNAQKIYRLTPNYSSWFGPHSLKEITPGHSFNETNKMTFYETIKSGCYTLKAGRLFILNGEYYNVASKPIEVHIVK
jgi:hypothetical protein